MNTLSIGQVAKQSGIGIETIRFYERKGLIDEPSRRESGYRQYTDDVIRRLTFIQQAKTLGFTLNEIHELLSLRSQPGVTSREIKQLAQAKLGDIEQKIKMLKRIQKSLKTLVDQCSGIGPTDECPIIEALDKRPTGKAG